MLPHRRPIAPRRSPAGEGGAELVAFTTGRTGDLRALDAERYGIASDHIATLNQLGELLFSNADRLSDRRRGRSDRNASGFRHPDYRGNRCVHGVVFDFRTAASTCRGSLFE